MDDTLVEPPQQCAGGWRHVSGLMILADAAAPTLLRENDKSNALYVLMPMRV